jgi:hypothetical protein
MDTILKKAEHYLSLNTMLEQLEFFNSVKNKTLKKWIKEVNLSESHKNTKKTKDEHLNFLIDMLK